MRFTNVILQTATKVIVFIILTFALQVLFSGHHNPGGGFVGGLVTASAIILLMLAYDSRTVRDVLPVHFRRLGAFGILIAVLTGCAAMLAGSPFLDQVFSHVELPLIGDMELASAILFDVGVFFTVIGTTMTIISAISEDE
ncbi:MAG: Na(+)/H(+) antiporter subunit B [Paenibacillaceae bacterium ZCTH02-B3]|nr:MAG: Na(+)/H(+) antiporter subunit B [Paenibacillaceae bacterium ZCTH02-B3]